LRFKTVIILF